MSPGSDDPLIHQGGLWAGARVTEVWRLSPTFSCEITRRTHYTSARHALVLSRNSVGNVWQSQKVSQMAQGESVTAEGEAEIERSCSLSPFIGCAHPCFLALRQKPFYRVDSCRRLVTSW